MYDDNNTFGYQFLCVIKLFLLGEKVQFQLWKRFIRELKHFAFAG